MVRAGEADREPEYPRPGVVDRSRLDCPGPTVHGPRAVPGWPRLTQWDERRRMRRSEQAQFLCAPDGVASTVATELAVDHPLVGLHRVEPRQLPCVDIGRTRLRRMAPSTSPRTVVPELGEHLVGGREVPGGQ